MNTSEEKYSAFLLFEHPLSERMRTYLRLEQLFNRYKQNLSFNHHAAHRSALVEMNYIMDVLERGDLKVELIKDLDKRIQSFNQLKDNPIVDEAKLSFVLHKLEKMHRWACQHNERFGQSLRTNELFTTIRHKLTTVKGSCADCDCPQLSYFLQQDPAQRRQQLITWFEVLKGLNSSIDILMKLTRENGEYTTVTAKHGSYQQEGTSAQLLRVRLSREIELFPEISASKHHLGIRFVPMSNKAHASIPIEFELAQCL